MNVIEPHNGWHWKEWLAEGAGTATLMFAVVTAKDLAVRAGPPLRSLPWRVILVAVVAGLTVVAVAVSALGRRSGAHLNPALTLGLWLQRVVSAADLAGYCVAQLAGGVLGIGLARLWGPTIAQPPVDWARIRPAPGIPPPAAAGLECAATLIQLGVVFLMLTSHRHHRWTPAVAAALLTATIIVLAPLSGAGNNPVRALAPDVLANIYPAVWIYIAGPLLGAALAAGALIAARRRPLTGKLHHDPSILCHMRCTLPHLASTH